MKQFVKHIVMAILIIAFVVTGVAVIAPQVSAAGAGMVVGSTTGTGAAINISTGFKPRYVLVSRVSATAANNYQATYTSSMTSGYCILHTAGGLTWVTSACISPYSGSTTVVPGFTIGTNASINATGDTLYYQAIQ